jgi:hypothetical protein
VAKLQHNQFEHEGVTYTVRARNLFDDSLFNATLVDVARLVADDKGYKSLDDLPAVLDSLIATYVRWAQVTDADVSFLNAFAVPFTDVNEVYNFIHAVTRTDLGAKWQAVYEAVNKEQQDPQPASGGEAPENS